jgi:protein required for attachment to host cells
LRGNSSGKSATASGKRRFEMAKAAVKLPEGAWVVVCDGRKALILENIGDAEYPDLRTRDVDKQEHPPTSDLGTDRPGRSHQSVGSHRSAMEETDWHEQAEDEFLADLVRRLDSALLSKEVKDLVIVAPPRALGALRKTYSTHIQSALIAEIDKDLTTMPVDQIEKHLIGG